MADVKEQVISKLMESIPALLIILGAGFVLLGISQGVKGWLIVTDPVSRGISGAVGLGLIGLGLYRAKPQTSFPKAKDHQITITHPKPGEGLAMTDVRGTIEGTLPEGYTLKIFRFYPGGNFYPLRDCRVDASGTAWEANACEIGDRTDDIRWLAVMMVGPSGAALIKYLRDANDVHNRVREDLQKLRTGERVPFPPLVETPTRDMIECARVEVRRA